ncbi:MAG: hypothetical protein WCO00_00225 [Rhodospirillaceae bacterium]
MASSTTINIDEIMVEVYRRAVRLYGATVTPWMECLNEAISSIQIEFDYWVMAPKAA